MTQSSWDGVDDKNLRIMDQAAHDFRQHLSNPFDAVDRAERAENVAWFKQALEGVHAELERRGLKCEATLYQADGRKMGE